MTTMKALKAHEAEAWRGSRPLEDPEKTKRWGLVTAKPSEFLIHMRRGRLLASQQGGSCFKLPWDSVAIVPTTIQRLAFTADQVTVEKVGVEVAGLAVYRVVAPLIAYRMLNFSYGERASEKLAEILEQMLVGATRRLVANLTVDDALTRRKDAIASELMAELAPVVEGVGRPEDTTATGWGVVVDTVEIQDVRILSEAVFDGMQAPFRAQLEQERIRADAATRQRRAEEERRIIELEQQNVRRQAELEEETAAMRATARAAQREAESLAALVLDKRKIEQARVVRESTIELARKEGEVQNALARARKEIDDVVPEERLRLALVQALPEIAGALSPKVAEMRLTSIGSDAAGPAALVTSALAQVLDLARGLGLSFRPDGGGTREAS